MKMYQLRVVESVSLAEVGKRFGVSRQRVSQLFKEAGLPVHSRARRRVRPHEEKAAAARRALTAAGRAADGPLTADAYEVLRARRGSSWPAAGTVALLLGDGSWLRALQSVGVQTIREYQRTRFSRRREQIVAIWPSDLTCAQIADAVGTTPSYLRLEVCRMRKLGYDVPDRRRKASA